MLVSTGCIFPADLNTLELSSSLQLARSPVIGHRRTPLIAGQLLKLLRFAVRNGVIDGRQLG